MFPQRCFLSTNAWPIFEMLIYSCLWLNIAQWCAKKIHHKVPNSVRSKSSYPKWRWNFQLYFSKAWGCRPTWNDFPYPLQVKEQKAWQDSAVSEGANSQWSCEQLWPKYLSFPQIFLGMWKGKDLWFFVSEDKTSILIFNQAFSQSEARNNNSES